MILINTNKVCLFIKLLNAIVLNYSLTSCELVK